MSVFSSRLCRLAIGFLPIVFVVSLSNRASATCGDYVHILRANGMDSGNQSDRLAKDIKAKVPCPCQGPRCEQVPIQPTPLPVAPPTTSTPSPDAILLDSSTSDSANSWSGFQDFFVMLPHVSESIFHPPRS